MARRHFQGWSPGRLALREAGHTVHVWLPRGSLFPSSDWLQICSELRVSREKWGAFQAWLRRSALHGRGCL